MLTTVLIALAVLAVYALSLLAKPEKRCRACNGWGTKGRWRPRPCRRCGSTGIRFRLGAPLVHRAAAAALRSRINHTPDDRTQDHTEASRWPRPRH